MKWLCAPFPLLNRDITVNTDINNSTDRTQLSAVLIHFLSACKRQMFNVIWQRERNIIFFVAIVLTACGKAEPVLPPKNIKVNPNPTEKYLVTMHVDDDVNGIHDVSVTKIYIVDNITKCSPKDSRFGLGGGWHSIQRNVNSKLDSAAVNTYKAVVTNDYFVDESYYGMAPCHWKLDQIFFTFYRDEIIYEGYFGLGEEIEKNEFVARCQIIKNNNPQGMAKACNSSKVGDYFNIKMTKKRITKGG